MIVGGVKWIEINCMAQKKGRRTEVRVAMRVKKSSLWGGKFACCHFLSSSFSIAINFVVGIIYVVVGIQDIGGRMLTS